MKKVLIYLKKYIKETIFAPLLKMSEALLELFVPIVIANIVDVGISSGTDYIIKQCLILLALGALGLLFSVSAQYMSARAAVGMATDLKADLFRHIQSFSYAEHEKIGASTLITRMTSDINQVQSGVNLTLRLFLRSPFIVFGSMIMAFTLDVKSALVFVVCIPLLSVVVFSVMAVTIPKYKNVQEKLDSLLLTTRENLSGVRVFRAFCKEQDEIENFNEKNSVLNIAQRAVAKISSLTNPLTFIIVNISAVVLIWIGAIRVDSGDISQGTVIALYNYMAQILVELIKLANLIVSITKSIASAGRISKVFEVQDSTVDSETVIDKFDFKSKIAVQFKDVSFKYPDSSENSLQNISFVANTGETIGIIGGTGSGKTTLVNLISRFYDITGGELEIFGKPVTSVTEKFLRDNIAIVPQKAELFKGSIRDNIKMGKMVATEEELNTALKISQAEEFVLKKDGELDYQIEQYGKNLSGGQKQRLAIARAIIKNAPILILDDSASALDLATDAKLRKALKELPQNPTVFIVSQRVSAVMNSDKILVLDDGELVSSGTHDELLKNSDVYKEICNSQFGGEEQ
ncbi:MAG: ABC transporter ATP-binding protein [Ruminococcaceae bacterium]|nr:ABC transporter ATP-binding protein [Oscillospiraceae bacterium]